MHPPKGKELRAVVRWAMNEGLLGELSLAKEHSDWVDGKRKGVEIALVREREE